MFTHILIFTSVLIALGGSLALSGEREYVFLFLLPIALSLSFLLLLSRGFRWFWIAFGFIVCAVSYQTIRYSLWVSGSLYLIFFASMVFLVFSILRRMEKSVALNETVLEKSIATLSLVQQRDRKEEGSIREFQQKVNNLLRLYEVAKDFNTCLNFQDLLTTLKDSVLEEIPCHSMRVLLLSRDSDRLKIQGFQMSRKGLFVWLKDKELSSETIQRLWELETVTKLQTTEELKSSQLLAGAEGDLETPLWIFPLRIETEHIAFLLLEGAREENFYQFQIVAGELALQIQKTLLYERVHALALYDGLTQVFVRRHIEDRLSEELRRSHTYRHPLSVLMLDIDYFKRCNDQYGHLVGDRILREIAGIIRETVRNVDLVGRYGGEEFILIFPEADAKGSLDGAERIRSAVAKKKIKVYDEEVRMTVSIGIATFPDDIGEVGKVFDPSWKQRLMEMADEALYQAKEDGRNQVKPYPKRKG